MKKIDYDEKTEIAEVTYDDKRINKQQIIKKLKKTGYKVSE